MILFHDASPAFHQARLQSARLRISNSLIIIGIAGIFSILCWDVIRISEASSRKQGLAAIVIKQN